MISADCMYEVPGWRGSLILGPIDDLDILTIDVRNDESREQEQALGGESKSIELNTNAELVLNGLWSARRSLPNL